MARKHIPVEGPRTATAWEEMLGGDPVPWLLSSDEPAARWVTLTAVLDRAPTDPAVLEAREWVVSDTRTHELVERLPDWASGVRLSGHESPAFAPTCSTWSPTWVYGDFDRIEALLDAMLAHQEPSGRFPSYGVLPGGSEPIWGSLLCDSHPILEVLVRFGREKDPRVQSGLARMASDLTATPQGRAWPCLPHSASGWCGPGRKSDFCPMVTLQALRTFARLSAADHPGGLLEVARVSLRAWRMRGVEKPYQFGHGRQFKIIKLPPTWYGAYPLLDTVSRYPQLWRGTNADPVDVLSLAELAACLVAYNVSPEGTVTPRSTYRGFETFSIGQKKRSSPLATAFLLAVLRRLDDLAPAAAAVDVAALASSKGGRGSAVPPTGLIAGH